MSIKKGFCYCGCGQYTEIATQTRSDRDWVKGEPKKYIRGHQNKTPETESICPPNPSGSCMCGCGEVTSIAIQTHTQSGIVKGEHLRYVQGHEWRGFRRNLTSPNPSGLCMCGCGEETSIARQTDIKAGTVKGEYVKYVSGHTRKKQPSWHEEDRGYDTPCWIWDGSKNGHGYGISRNGKGKSVLAHRRIYSEYYEIFLESSLHHLCEVKDCVRPNHLIEMNREKHSSLHASLKDKEVDGIRWIPKLNKHLAQEIRDLHERGYSYSYLSNKYEVSYTLIGLVIRREVW